MRKLWANISRLISRGIDPELPDQFQKQLRVVQSICWLYFLGILPYPFLYFEMGYPLMAWVDIGVLGSLLGIILLGQLGKHAYNREALLGVMIVSQWISQSLLGESLSLLSMTFLNLLLPLLVLETSHWKSILVFELISLLGFVLVLFDAFPYLATAPIRGEPQLFLQIYIDISNVFAFCILAGFFYVDLVRQGEVNTRSREQAVEANLAKTRFMSTMSHEIRTPLNALVGLVDLLENTSLDDEQEEYVDILKLSGETLLSVVNNVLDYSKIEAEGLSLEEIRFSLPDTLQHVRDLFSIKAQKRGLTIHLESDLPQSQMLLGDPNRLKQILINLISNSIKFTYEGKVVVRAFDLGRTNQHQQVCITVADTGIGIEAEQVENLFQPYKQAAPSISREFGGTGLGLAIVYELVQLMGGNIQVESKPGLGTTFAVELRFLIHPTLPNLSQGTAHSLKPHTPAIRILLVEDVPTNQKAIMHILKRLGHQIRLASNGQNALEVAQGFQPELVLMDLGLPTMGGLAATEKMLSHCHKMESCPVIVALTADATEEARQRCLEIGMKDFLAKPVRYSDLQKLIQRWFP